MAMAGLGRDGAEAISKALKENRSLLELDISLNRIGLEGARDVAKGMKENDTLRVLRVRIFISSLSMKLQKMLW